MSNKIDTKRVYLDTFVLEMFVKKITRSFVGANLISEVLVVGASFLAFLTIYGAPAINSRNYYGLVLF